MNSVRTRTVVTVVVVLLISAMLAISILQQMNFTPDPRELRTDWVLLAAKYKEQRNSLSEILNGVKQELSIMGCQLQALTINESTTAGSGGWCEETSRSGGGSHMFDSSLAQALTSLFTNQSVASFGDGPGDYKKFIDKTKKVQVYDAFDGAPFGKETSGGVVRFLDLTAPQYGLPVYDWVISLEVAEHIPAQYESVYIDNIVRHASGGIVLSWAVPGQGGLSHINNKPLAYVQKILSEKGFDPDMNTSKVLQKQATYDWLKRNVFVYRRRPTSILQPDDA